MTAFDKPFLFIDNPAGGTDQLDKMKAAGFQGAFANVIDYEPAAWNLHRQRAAQQGMFFGPWGRTGHPPPQGTGFESAKADKILDTAVLWKSPAILNCEKEIDNSGYTITKQIANLAQGLDVALSVEAWPFGNVDWTPVAHLPALPQIFPQDWGWVPPFSKTAVMQRATEAKAAWHARGIKCVYFTFGSYGAALPTTYERQAPFSLFTADAIGVQNYPLWSPTSTGFKGCIEVTPEPIPPKPNTVQTRASMIALGRPWCDAYPANELARIMLATEILELGDAQHKQVAPAIRALLDGVQE